MTDDEIIRAALDIGATAARTKNAPPEGQFDSALSALDRVLKMVVDLSDMPEGWILMHVTKVVRDGCWECCLRRPSGRFLASGDEEVWSHRETIAAAVERAKKLARHASPRA